MTEQGIHLSDAANLSEEPGPAQTSPELAMQIAKAIGIDSDSKH